MTEARESLRSFWGFHGLVTGPPLPAGDGRLAVAEQGLALLEHVAGRELEGETEEEQRLLATTLAAVHLAGDPLGGPTTAVFMTDWLTPRLPGGEAHPWVRSVIETVRAETRSPARHLGPSFTPTRLPRRSCTTTAPESPG